MRDYPINRVLTAQGSIVILYIIIKIIFQQLLNLYNMKKSAFLALFLAVFIFNNAQAAILTVNNTDPSPAQYSTIAAAIAAAADNDTILISGSERTYSGTTMANSGPTTEITKPLTLMGPGFNPGKQMSFPCRIESITLKSNVHDVNLLGLIIQNFFCQTNVDNILIRNCSFSGIAVPLNCNNWIISNNVFSSQISATGSNWTNVLITNNIFSGGQLNNFSMVQNVVVQNNVFNNVLSATADPFGGDIFNLIISNNIFYNARFETGTVVYKNNVWSKNISYSDSGTLPFPQNTVLPTTLPNHIQNTNNSFEGNMADTDPKFEKYNGGPFSYGNNYRLKTTSPGRNAGTDGTDIGVYGSGVQFSMTGEPGIPVVRTFMILNTTTTSGGNLNISVTASKARVD
jgi:hypothetical protein